jgi:hypothetical protein
MLLSLREYLAPLELVFKKDYTQVFLWDTLEPRNFYVFNCILHKMKLKPKNTFRFSIPIKDKKKQFNLKLKNQIRI